MTPEPQLEPHSLDRIVQASAGYIIPATLLAVNLVAFLSQDETRPYELLRINVLAFVCLLYAQHRGDRGR